jgi:hypothetical protein
MPERDFGDGSHASRGGLDVEQPSRELLTTAGWLTQEFCADWVERAEFKPQGSVSAPQMK